MIVSEIKNLQIEQAVLATLMTVAGSYAQVESKLGEEDFFASRHKLIFKAIADLDSKNSPYDAVLVHEYLESHNQSDQAGGEQYLMKLMGDAPSSFYNLDSYTEKLKDLTVCRKVELEALNVLHKARNLTVSRGDLVLNAQSAFAEINTEAETECLVHIHEAASQTFGYLEEKMEAAVLGNPLIKGIQTGIYELDQKLGDVVPGSLLILAAP